jgi:soluble lytic murein transglycosylase-like protein
MMADSQFRLVFTSVDKVTAMVNRIEKRLGDFGKRAKVGAGDLISEKLANMQLDRIAKSAGSIGAQLAKVAQPMSLVAGAATLSGLAAATSNWAGLGSSVLKTSQIIGVSTQDLQSLRGAAQLAGVSAEQLDGGMAQLGSTMNDALYGRNMQALAMLQKLNIGIHRTKDGAIDTVRAFKDLADALTNPKMSAQTKAMVATQFGLSGLLPMLGNGSKGIAAGQGRAAQLGMVMTPAQLQAASVAEQNKRESSLAGQHMQNYLGEHISPLYNAILEMTTKWMANSPGMTLAGAAAGGIVGSWVVKKSLSAISAKLLSSAAKSVAGTLGESTAAAEGAAITGSLTTLARAISAWVGRLSVPVYAAMHSDELNAGENEWIANQQKNRPAAKNQAEANRGSVNQLFAKAAQKYNLPVELFDSAWLQESSRGKNMVSPKGAQGHFGFMPATAKQYGLKNPNDLIESTDAYGRMMRDLLNQNHGNLPMALAAYNGGQGRLEKRGLARMPLESRQYAADIMSRMGGVAPAAVKGAQAGGDDQATLLSRLNDTLDKLAKINVNVHVTGLPAGISAKSTGAVGQQYNYPMPEMVTP